MRPIRCLCSRCDIFFRAQNSDNLEDIINYQDGSDACAKSKDFEQREYQTALIKIAIKRNIIACLPTGSGKTFIAYKLIEHFQHDIGSKGKKVFFLANTIPLVNQQAAFFARNMTLKVRHFTGDMEVDYWTKAKWEVIINDTQILAMTAQIFLNMVRHAQIQLSQIALIIFDECHHAQNEHPMKQIMVEYHNVKKKHPDYALPRILGLTATIIMGTCKVYEVPARVRELESTMDSIAVTYKDYEEVMLHSTSAIVEPVRIDEACTWNYDQMFLDELDKNGKELQALRKERKKLKAGLTTISGIDPTLASSNNIYLCNKKPTPGDLRIAVDDVRRTYLDMGDYCAVIAINLRLAFINFSLMDLTDAVMKDWYNKIRVLFENFRDKLLEKMRLYSERVRVTDFITPKLRTLIHKLEKRFQKSTECSIGCESDENQLCGLIFTDRRVTAQVLAWYLKDLSATDEKYSFIRANFVVGTSRCPFETVESRIYAKKQTTTINAFRSRKFNLLTATSVLEEGIDVPSCNLVIRFDPIKTYTSYVQSMGRARRKNALFYAFLDAGYYAKGVSNINNFKEINEAMVAHLRAQVMKIEDEWNGHFTDTAEHSVEPFCPGGTADSPRVTMESAQEVVQNYCNLLPNDGISSLQTLSWWTEHYNPTLCYQGHVKLPLNSVLQGTVDGEKMKSKELARQSAYLEVAKLLYEKDALDDRLCPVRPTFPPKVEAFFNILDPFTATGDGKEVNGAAAACMEEGELAEGDTDMDKAAYLTRLTRLFKKKWYSKKIPSIFQNGRLVVGKRYNVYRICMALSEENPKNKWKELYKLENANTSFGIISAEEIPEIGQFPLFGVFGTMSVRVKKIPNFSINLNDANFRTLRVFQQIVFRNILDVGHPLLTEDNELSFVIIPLEKEMEGWKVYEDLFPRDTRRGEDPHPGINEIFTCERIRAPHEETRKRNSRANRFQKNDKESYIRKYKDAVIFPWYKGKSRPLYVVDSVETEMTPNSRFHDGNFPTYRNFVLKQYKKETYNLEQPMLKCKLAGVGKGRKQMNYLLEKYTKEEEFPVYLIPELCIVLNIPASILVQVKFLPSILHRLFRFLTAREFLTSLGDSCGWTGILSSHMSGNTVGPDPDGQFTIRQGFDKDKEEERRQNREEARKRLKRPHQPINQKKRIEDRELHYEFIHPNKITKKDIELFHQAVSGQHSAKKLSLANKVESELANTELYEGSTIPLLGFDEFVLPSVDVALNFDTDSGPSVLSLLEGITKANSNEGISNDRLKMIGLAFLNYAVSTQAYNQFPTWVEPVLCHLRNRLVSVQVLSTIAKKKNLGEILAGSGFYPDATWCPPGFQLIPHVGEIAAANSVHLGVFHNDIRRVKNMTKEELEKHVSENALSVLQMEAPTGAATAPGQLPQPFIKFATYTHSEISNWDLADGLCAMVGAFFTQTGVQGGLKMLEWLEFTMPDADGDEHLIGTWSFSTPDISETVSMEEVEAIIPNYSKLEELLGYKFKNRKYLLEALAHPSYFTSSISESYQRLQFLGDGILELLLTNHIFTTPSKLSIQSLAEIKSALVNNITYASLAVRYDLHKYLLSMSKPLLDMIDNFVIHQEAAEHRVIGHFTLISDAECWGPKHIEVPKVLGDLFEALAGAIFLDSDFSLDTVWKVYYRLMQNEIHDFFEEIPKSPLRELKAEFPEPGQIVFKNWTSQKLRARGREMFKINVGHLGQYFGSGTNKTRAKEAAAKVALKMCKDDDSIIAKYDGATILMMI